MKFAKRKNVLIASLLALISLGSFSFAYVTAFPPAPEVRPNILIISLCSFRYKMLSEYNGGQEVVMPALEKFFANSSYIFSNAFNGMPWTAIFATAQNVLSTHDLLAFRYTHLPNSSRNYILRVPHRESWVAPSSELVDDNDFEKRHIEETEYLKRSLLEGVARRPFYVVAHYKYMHYPLIDRHNPDAEWDYYLTPQERAKVADYQAHPEKYPDKLPFLLLLTNDPAVPLNHPRVQGEMKKTKVTGKDKQVKFKGLLTDPAFIAAWKNHPGYADDMAILTKIYKANARYLDKVLAPVFDLWGDKELQKNTIVMVTGDHGEMHMEHDRLTHAHSLHEEVLRIPAAIRFPGQTDPVRVEQQVNFKTFSALLRGLVAGDVNGGNFERSLRRVQDDYMVLRTCLNNMRGVRYKNEYKYIHDIAQDQPYLYDLKADPGETKNIADEHPDLVEKFETAFWQEYPEYRNVDHGDCPGWGASAGSKGGYTDDGEG